MSKNFSKEELENLKSDFDYYNLNHKSLKNSLILKKKNLIEILKDETFNSSFKYLKTDVSEGYKPINTEISNTVKFIVYLLSRKTINIIAQNVLHLKSLLQAENCYLSLK